MQYSQPMQTLGSMTTGPSSYLVIASTGQTAAHIGYSQCMQLFLAQSGESPSSTGGFLGVPVPDGISQAVVRGGSFQSLPAWTHLPQARPLSPADRIRRGLPARH